MFVSAKRPDQGEIKKLRIHIAKDTMMLGHYFELYFMFLDLGHDVLTERSRY